MKVGLVMILGLLLWGCASTPPVPLDREPPGNPRLSEVRLAPEKFSNVEVRWGGEIVKVENKATYTWIEIIGRELRPDTRPKAGSHSDGRFIARIDGFVDPAVYQAGYLLSVIGRLDESVVRPIGEFEYTFPVVSVTGSHLWEPESELTPSAYPPPWWYHDPWYYYPRPYPYYRW